MTRQQLFQQISEKGSCLCVGLDSDIQKIPKHLFDYDDPIFEFNRRIIDATLPHCVAYKPNIAFYESQGAKGWDSLTKTLNYIPKTHFTIADAKRGDIGNTSKLYAQTFFKTFDFDAVTVAPYMGEDSVRPFLDFDNKWVIVLGLTSNEGSQDFQFLESQGKPLHEHIIEKVQQWGTPNNLMFVIGATHPEAFKRIRNIAPDNFFLVPGVGAQGGDLDGVMRYGQNKECGLLINASRGVIFADAGIDFDKQAGLAAQALSTSMSKMIIV